MGVTDDVTYENMQMWVRTQYPRAFKTSPAPHKVRCSPQIIAQLSEQTITQHWLSGRLANQHKLHSVSACIADINNQLRVAKCKAEVASARQNSSGQ